MLSAFHHCQQSAMSVNACHGAVNAQCGSQATAVQTPQPKRLKALANSGPPAAAGSKFLEGLKIYAPSTGIHFISVKSKFWASSVAKAGGSFTQDPKAPGITHVIVGEGGIGALPPQLQPGGSQPASSEAAVEASQHGGAASEASADSARKPAGGSDERARGAEAISAVKRPHKGKRPAEAPLQVFPTYVSPQWIERCLARRELLPATDFPPLEPEATVSTPEGQAWSAQRGGESLGSGAPSAASALQGEVAQRLAWLGRELWHPRCAHMSLNELALQAVYSQKRSEEVGNEPVVKALVELYRYERALHEDYFIAEHGRAEKQVNHRALRYSRAASVVRACAYKLQAGLRGGDLPFVGDVTAQQINDIITTGTTKTLECLRANAPVTDSRGRKRWDTAGGATRAKFHSLPGVGVQTAKRWWDVGCRSFEDVEVAARPGGLLAADGPWPLSVEQRCSLAHRDDLLAATTPEEVQEMLEAVRAGLEAVSAPRWRAELVGGGRRSAAFHDADVLVTHPTHSVEGVVEKLRDHLIAQGRMVPPEEGMCRVQAGLLPDHIQRLKEEHEHDVSDAPSQQTLDKFDHVYGLYRTQGGKVRRLDVIVTPADEWCFAQVGWIGSRMYLRFMRQHLKDAGFFLNSHRLMQKQGSESYVIPDERPPLDKQGNVRWPPGWEPGRKIETERDVFDFLQIPWHEAHERDAP